MKFASTKYSSFLVEYLIDNNIEFNKHITNKIIFDTKVNLKDQLGYKLINNKHGN